MKNSSTHILRCLSVTHLEQKASLSGITVVALPASAQLRLAAIFQSFTFTSQAPSPIPLLHRDNPVRCAAKHCAQWSVHGRFTLPCAHRPTPAGPSISMPRPRPRIPLPPPSTFQILRPHSPRQVRLHPSRRTWMWSSIDNIQMHNSRC